MSASEIKAIRLRLGLSQAGFAAGIGVHVMTVSRWERGWSKPTPETIRLLKAMGGKR